MGFGSRTSMFDDGTAARTRIVAQRGRLAVSVLSVAVALLVSAPAVWAAQGSPAGSQEAPGIREALARQLQMPGPSVVSQGGSGGSGDAQAPSGSLLPAAASANSNTWLSHEGTRVTRVYNVPVNYQGADGSWHAIDNSLVGSPLGGYENAANSFSLRLPDSLQSSVSLSFEGHSVSFSLEGATTGQPSVSGTTATYADVLASTSLAYTSESSGVREVATLADTNAPEQLRYALTLPAGLSPKLRSDGSITVVDGQGVRWFTIPAPVAYRSASGTASGRSVPMSVSGSASSWVITVDTSESWLRELLASGPVAIDPSVTVSGSQACTLNSESVKTSACSAGTLQEGYDSTHAERHALLEFNLSSLPQGALVLNAKLGLYVEAKSTSNAKAVGVYRVTKPWTTGATWETYDGTHNWATAGGDYNNPSEKSDAVVNSSVGATTGWYYWYPTKMVQEWANTTNAPEGEGAANEGLIVKDQTDNVTQNLLTIDSPTASTDKPYLEVTYDNRGQGVSPQYTQLSTALNDKLQMSVNVGSGDLMLANEDLRIAGINGKDFQSDRYFNSLDPSPHDLGRWRETMTVELTAFANGDVYTGNGTGQHYVFIKQANGSYLTPPGIKAKLCGAATKEALCPASLPSGVAYRLVYENPSEDYVDFTSKGWTADQDNKYGQKLTATFSESPDAITSWTDTRGRVIKYKTTNGGFYTEMKDEAGARATKDEYGTTAEETPLLAYTDANGKTTKYVYESGNLTKITDPAGNVTKFKYEEHRIKEVIRVTNTEAGTGPTTKFEYKKLGEAPAPCTSKQKATIVKDPDWSTAGEHEELYCINVLDEVEKKLDGTLNSKKELEYSNESASEYNPFGDQTSSTAAAPGSGEAGGIANLHYDEAGVNLTCAVQNGKAKETESVCPSRPSETALITSYEYKDAANSFSATQTENPQGHTISSCYNGGEPSCGTGTGPRGTLSSKEDQLSEQNKLTFEYNKEGTLNGTISSSKDADGNKTEYFYDEKGNLKEIKPPAPQTPTTIKVDADSRPEVIEDGAKHKETISYEKDDRITKIVYSGTGTEKTVSFEYDANGNLTKREDSTGTAKYTVDALNRLTKEELPGSLTHSYEYDNASNLTSFTDGGGTTKYRYNGLNELESMTEPKELGTDTFNYKDDHRLNKITYPSKAVENYQLEPTTGRPETITAEGVTGTPVPTLSYSYKKTTEKGAENSSEIQTLTETPSKASTNYTYDKLERLVEAVTTTANESRYAFKLDGAGNRLEQAVNLTGHTEGAKTYYAYNADNELECRLTVAPPCTANSTTEKSGYEYDKAGEETAIIAKGDTSGTAFAYNAASELSTLTPSGESALSLTYGGTGQDDLISRGSSTTVENSLLGISRETNSSGAWCFERTPEGLLIDIRTPTANYNPLYDAQGDIIGLANSTAEVKRTFHYGPYGENVKATGTEAEGPFIFGYKSGYRMPGGNKGATEIANGLYHYGERYYDPTTGRWTQQDPVSRIVGPAEGEGLGESFVFAGEDPVNFSDPSGESLQFHGSGPVRVLASACAAALCWVYLPTGRLPYTNEEADGRQLSAQQVREGGFQGVKGLNAELKRNEFSK